MFLICYVLVFYYLYGMTILNMLFTLLDLCVSSLRRGHTNLLCVVPILPDDPRKESEGDGLGVVPDVHEAVAEVGLVAQLRVVDPHEVGAGDQEDARAQETPGEERARERPADGPGYSSKGGAVGGGCSGWG